MFWAAVLPLAEWLELQGKCEPSRTGRNYSHSLSGQIVEPRTAARHGQDQRFQWSCHGGPIAGRPNDVGSYKLNPDDALLGPERDSDILQVLREFEESVFGNLSAYAQRTADVCRVTDSVFERHDRLGHGCCLMYSDGCSK
jgi:hypothetical protein